MKKVTLPQTGLDLLFNITRDMGEPYQAGKYTIVPVTGRFEGPVLKGEIVSGGADWNTVEAGIVNMDSKYILKTDDGAFISLRMRGWDVGGYIRAHLFFTASKKYQWLNGIVALARSSQNGGIDAFAVR